MTGPDATLSGSFAIGGDLAVRRLGFGAMRLCGPKVWGEADDPENALAVLRRAVDLGVTLIDTAEVYGPFVNERQVADALHPYPPGLVLATKCGARREWLDGEDWPRFTADGREASIRASIEGSLERLKVETIDLYQIHRLDPALQLEDEVGTLARLRDEGKLRHIGLSQVTVDELARARAVTPIATVQNRYNLLDREDEAVLVACEAAGIGFMPWFPVGGGPKALAGVPAIAAVAHRHGATPVQIALAWLLARSPVMLPIPGTASLTHLDENIGAAALRLDGDDMAALNDLGRAA